MSLRETAALVDAIIAADVEALRITCPNCNKMKPINKKSSASAGNL